MNDGYIRIFSVSENNIKDLTVDITNFVATIEIRRPPHNFFDVELITQIADTYSEMDSRNDVRAIVLCAEGKNFCAGANLGASNVGNAKDSSTGVLSNDLYRQAVRIFRSKKPVVAAVQGAAIGGGLGLAVSADFRVTCPEGRFSANFTKLGFHPGFGLTLTLPSLIGKQRASLMCLTSRRIDGQQATTWGLADLCVPLCDVRLEAQKIAQEIASCAPLAVASTRSTLRIGLADSIAMQTDHELAEQNALRGTKDYKEGIESASQRREPIFQGK
ncbi:MAG: enoyl-CoA hydratase/isomerase family protein [Proteobacteria bacterium]|jgi:enoyl-CoA hydratase/carnithine racemase|nr:enoyl-CoA hydratase/isomerase family protein [Pseudomonadota bacterium]MBT6192330.1 enoyl-CoA hydratase/isomerase family protein [Pseudomonadota bacterium]MBT6675346.1 enoyl-CoA hydratase/isomerase family protein [Pseudomonadota bacterium]MBT7561836.1 enoyl-CoA hydratase/isomerase family protein [Pseudomonadota bacterium]MBT7626224.1 enoyl-CoA hydratase/isomerase family protein [Pseudomonadota bacterium]